MAELKAVTYTVTFKNPFDFNGVQYFAQVPYSFTGVAPSSLCMSSIILAQKDYSRRFSNVYFELAAPLVVAATQYIKEV